MKYSTTILSAAILSVSFGAQAQGGKNWEKILDKKPAPVYQAEDSNARKLKLTAVQYKRWMDGISSANKPKSEAAKAVFENVRDVKHGQSRLSAVQHKRWSEGKADSLAMGPDVNPGPYPYKHLPPHDDHLSHLSIHHSDG